MNQPADHPQDCDCDRCDERNGLIDQPPSDRPAEAAEVGPIYNVPLLDALPLNYKATGGMRQALPSARDLRSAIARGAPSRLTAGYEVLLNHFTAQAAELETLREVKRKMERFIVGSLADRPHGRYTVGADLFDDGVDCENRVAQECGGWMQTTFFNARDDTPPENIVDWGQGYVRPRDRPCPPDDEAAQARSE